MRANPIQFMGPEAEPFVYDAARAVVIPVPYEAGTSYGIGAAGAPRAVLEASRYVELYDHHQGRETFRDGLFTVEELAVPDDPVAMSAVVEQAVAAVLANGKMPVVLGGDHSISPGAVRGMMTRHPDLGVIQLDAHADLRAEWDGSPLSHACAMARIRELTPHTLQLGIRNIAVDEAERIRAGQLDLHVAEAMRAPGFDLDAALSKLPNDVYITFDVDALDWSVVWSTGTPEPGGFTWDETIALLRRIFATRNVVGFDVVELSANEWDRNSPFAVAKLIYWMLGMKFTTPENAEDQ